MFVVVLLRSTTSIFPSFVSFNRYFCKKHSQWLKLLLVLRFRGFLHLVLCLRHLAYMHYKSVYPYGWGSLIAISIYDMDKIYYIDKIRYISLWASLEAQRVNNLPNCLLLWAWDVFSKQKPLVEVWTVTTLTPCLNGQLAEVSWSNVVDAYILKFCERPWWGWHSRWFLITKHVIHLIYWWTCWTQKAIAVLHNHVLWLW